jgi:3-dehydroquinate synthase
LAHSHEPLEPALVFTHPSELTEHLEMLLPENSKIFILTDSHVAQHCLPYLLNENPILENVDIIEVEPGEGSKSIEIVQQLYTHLIENEADRKSVLLNLGGGVITDLGGFVGSTFKRGMSVIHLPTSLMAMVDAAIGGKTGIDFLDIKNCIGTFSSEITTLVYTGWLDTLPEEEWRNGWAEMIKHGLVADRVLWQQIKHYTMPIAPEIVAWNIRIKEEIITADFQESGERKLLNFGHTLGHALESYFIASSTPRAHGYCIAIGMLVALRLSVRHTQLALAEANEAATLLTKALLPQLAQHPPFAELVPFLAQDKKNLNGELRFTLLEKIGTGTWNIPIALFDLEKAYTEVLEALAG